MSDQTPSLPDALFHFVLGDVPRLLDVDTQVEGLLGFTRAFFLNASITLPQCVHADDQDVAATLFSAERQPRQGTLNLRLRQAAGVLSPDDLRPLNALLVR